MDLEQLHAMCQEPRPHEQQQSNQQVFEKRAGLVIRSRLLRTSSCHHLEVTNVVHDK